MKVPFAPLLAALVLGTAGTLSAQTADPRITSSSPTLPSDTLEANYAPKSGAPGPSPELAPTLPSDTLEATQPVDSFPADRQGRVGSSLSDAELMQ